MDSYDLRSQVSHEDAPQTAPPLSAEQQQAKAAALSLFAGVQDAAQASSALGAGQALLSGAAASLSTLAQTDPSLTLAAEVVGSLASTAANIKSAVDSGTPVIESLLKPELVTAPTGNPAYGDVADALLRAYSAASALKDASPLALARGLLGQAATTALSSLLANPTLGPAAKYALNLALPFVGQVMSGQPLDMKKFLSGAAKQAATDLTYSALQRLGKVSV